MLGALILGVYLLCDPTCHVLDWGLPTPTGTPSARPTASNSPVRTPTATASIQPTPIPPTPAPTPPTGSWPLSDATAAGMVVRSSWEPRPENYNANHRVPTPSQLTQIAVPSWFTGPAYLKAVTGNFTGTTDEILQWAALKWGIDPDRIRAQAVIESHWHQFDIGDIGNGVSLGILQLKTTSWPGTCPAGAGATSLADPNVTSPNCLSNNYTAFAADYQVAVTRACVDGYGRSWLVANVPSAGYPAYKAGPDAHNSVEGCQGAWFSGNWYDAGALNYINQLKAALAGKVWLASGF